MTYAVDASLPEWACSWVSSLVQDEVRTFTQVGSQEVNRVFRLELNAQSLFLKVGPGLQREYEKLQWLQGRLPCPRPVGFTTSEGTDALLTSALNGEDLCDLCASLTPQVILSRLASALIKLHSTPIFDWPFGEAQEGQVLVHGDACLPNFIYCDGHLSGYIDVGDLTVGEPETDLAAAIRSLQRNLGSGHSLAFLREYGLKDADEELVETLRLLKS